MYVDVVFMPYTKQVKKNTTMNTTSLKAYCIVSYYL